MRPTKSEIKSFREPTEEERALFYVPLRSNPIVVYQPDEGRGWKVVDPESGKRATMTSDLYPYALLRDGRIAVPARREGETEEAYAAAMAPFFSKEGLAALNRPLSGRKRSLKEAAAADEEEEEGGDGKGEGKDGSEKSAKRRPLPEQRDPMEIPTAVMRPYEPLLGAIRSGDDKALRKALAALKKEKNRPATEAVGRRIFESILVSEGDRPRTASRILGWTAVGYVDAVRAALESGSVSDALSLLPPRGAPRGKMTHAAWWAIARAGAAHGSLDVVEIVAHHAAVEATGALDILRAGSPSCWENPQDAGVEGYEKYSSDMERFARADRLAAFYRVFEARFDDWDAERNGYAWGFCLARGADAGEASRTPPCMCPTPSEALTRKLYRVAVAGKIREPITQKIQFSLVAQNAKDDARALRILLEESVAAGEVWAVRMAIDAGAEPDARLAPPPSAKPEDTLAIFGLLGVQPPKPEPRPETAPVDPDSDSDSDSDADVEEYAVPNVKHLVPPMSKA